MAYDLSFLDFDAVQRLLESFTTTPYGAEAARNIEPPENLEVARQMQRSVTAARTLVDAQTPIELDAIPNIKPALRQAANQGALLSAKALINIKQVMEAAKGLVPVLKQWPPLYPQDVSDLTPVPELEALITQTVDNKGAVLKDASSKLLDLWEEYSGLRAEAEKLLKKLAQRDDLKVSIKHPERVYWQGERAVIAIHPDFVEKLKGVRRGGTPGGLDQLVEPIEAIGINNKIEKLSGQITMEQQRILREVTANVGANLPKLERLLDALTWIDLALAAGKFSAQLNAHAPNLLESPQVHLNQAYHPLLLMQFMRGTLQQPVSLSLKLGAKNRFILITGPNTGGKTVVLKTVGLLVVMAQCGLHIPAEEDCTIGWYNSVLVDMGDRQNLYHQLSTFAGHVEMLKRIEQAADENTLILLDELGTGTDPDEGAALAMALIDELVERKCHGIVNTHLSTLKEYAQDHPHVHNAAMVFDRNTLAPTYELSMGEPGHSFGLTIAERNGLPAEVIASARKYLEKINPILASAMNDSVGDVPK